MDKALGMQNPMVDNVVLLVSRLLLALIFVHEGVFLAANFAAASTAMAKVGVPLRLLSSARLPYNSLPASPLPSVGTRD